MTGDQEENNVSFRFLGQTVMFIMVIVMMLMLIYYGNCHAIIVVGVV